jgi:hypothetical protein
MHVFAFFLLLTAPSGRAAFDLSPTPLQPTIPLSFSPPRHHPFITTGSTDHHLLEEEHSQSSVSPFLELLDSFAQGRVPLVVCPQNALSPYTLAACKLDASSLEQAGFGATAGVASQTDGIRTGVHQIWLQSPRTDQRHASSLQYVMVGQMAARRDLIRWVDSLRSYLESSRLLAAPLLSASVELSYVLYQPGAYYLRHLDQSGGSRVISFILYLGDPTTTTDDNENSEAGSRPWDCVTDGGALRVYGSAAACTGNTVMCSREDGDDYDKAEQDDDESCRYYADITPTAGTLVIFDSATVKHEVMTTYRPRAAVVGWFRESVAAST